ncbi:DinB family protein [Flavobacterium procerum]|uniref:DinB family protein n=1 Tax=Flavobacterium procerum TaxID=1455569 RepID=A0ABV6C0H1_9FLAO
MENWLKKVLWRQFGASIDMLENACKLCPETFWDTQAEFGYKAYHCVFFLDYYLTRNPIGFTPPEPFSLSEFEDRMPERIYTKEEVLNYLYFCRKKCRDLIAGLDDVENAFWQNESESMRYNIIEILLYNMRHVQHHTAQLNLLLRQHIDDAPEWIYEAEDKL